jgi:hypothetical protein
MPKQIEGMPLSFKRRTAANHALLKTGFSRAQGRLYPRLRGTAAFCTLRRLSNVSNRRLTGHWSCATTGENAIVVEPPESNAGHPWASAWLGSTGTDRSSGSRPSSQALICKLRYLE